MEHIKEDYAGIPIRLARNCRLSGVKFSLRGVWTKHGVGLGLLKLMA